MKKLISFMVVFVCISVLIVGYRKAEDSNNSFKFSFSGNYLGFSDISSNYTIEQAKEDGHLVMQNSKIIANENVWDNFVKTSMRKENTSIRIAKFSTGLSNPYFRDVFYNDGYYYLFDSGAENLKKKPFLYLLTLEGETQSGYPLKDTSYTVLTNDDTLSFLTVQSAIYSSSMDYLQSVPPFRIVMEK